MQMSISPVASTPSEFQPGEAGRCPDFRRRSGVAYHAEVDGGTLDRQPGILSEAMHSSLDLVAAAITFVSVVVSDKPADLQHPFGHGKVEHLSAFMETGLLIATCLWIVYESRAPPVFHDVHVEPSLWAFGVMFISITIDTFRSRALFRVARKYNSQALEADCAAFLHRRLQFHGGHPRVDFGLHLRPAKNPLAARR